MQMLRKEKLKSRHRLFEKHGSRDHYSYSPDSKDQSLELPCHQETDALTTSGRCVYAAAENHTTRGVESAA